VRSAEGGELSLKRINPDVLDLELVGAVGEGACRNGFSGGGSFALGLALDVL